MPVEFQRFDAAGSQKCAKQENVERVAGVWWIPDPKKCYGVPALEAPQQGAKRTRKSSNRRPAILDLNLTDTTHGVPAPMQQGTVTTDERVNGVPAPRSSREPNGDVAQGVPAPRCSREPSARKEDDRDKRRWRQWGNGGAWRDARL